MTDSSSISSPQSSEKNMGSWFSKKGKALVKAVKEPKVDPVVAEMAQYTIDMKRVTFAEGHGLVYIPDRFTEWESYEEYDEILDVEEIEFDEEVEEKD